MCWPMLTSQIPSIIKGENKTKLKASHTNYNTDCDSILNKVCKSF